MKQLIFTQLKRCSAVFAALLVLFTIGGGGAVFAQPNVPTPAEYEISDLLYPFYDPDSEACEDPTNVSINANRVYLIGDSWLYGMMESDPSLETALSNRGMTLVKANAVVGRSINGAGQTTGDVQPQSGMEGLRADASLLSGVGKIVVVLGTNSDDYAGDIPQFMDLMKDSDAQKYWVNTAANRDDIIDSLNAANAAVQTHSTGEVPYTPIDWFAAAYPGGDPTNIDSNASSPLMNSDDQIHPSAIGYQALIEMIVSTIGGSSSAPAIGGATGSASRTSLPQVAQDRLAAVESLVYENQAAYESAAANLNLPWQALAALHYRESGLSRTNPNNDDGLFQIESMSFPAGQLNTDAQLTEQIMAAGNILKSMGNAVYEVDLVATSTAEDFKHAFLAYNRGYMYKNVPPSEGGPWLPDLSPYVMNLYSDDFIGADGQGMQFPVGNSGNRGGTIDGRRWGETVSGTNNSAGAMTFMAYFGMSTPGAAQGGCSNTGVINEGAFLWPVVNDQNEPGGHITACWSDYRTRTVSGGTYYHSGIDIGAAEGTDVVSMQNGTVVYAGFNDTYGNLVIIRHDGTPTYWSHYGHMVRVEAGIAVDTPVRAGQKIGEVGNTGVSVGDHLHLNLYDHWPFGAGDAGVFSSNGQETLNAFTHGLSIPDGIEDDANCINYPTGGRPDSVAI